MFLARRELQQASRLLIFEEADSIACNHGLPLVGECTKAILGQLTE